MQPLRLVFSFDHLTSALFSLGLSTSLNAAPLADPRCRRFSAPDHTQTLFPLPLPPFQNPPGLMRARNLLDLRIRTGTRPGARSRIRSRIWAWSRPRSHLVWYVQAPFYVLFEIY